MKPQLSCPAPRPQSGPRRSRAVLTGGLVAGALVLLNAVTAFADPAWYDGTNQKGVQPGSPDFYQHQTTEAQANGGWCWQTAFEDLMFYYSFHGYGSLYTGNASWVNAMNTNLANIINTPGGDAFMMNYINNQGYSGSLGQTTTLNPGGGFGIFNAFTSDMLNNSNVLIHIDPNGVSGLWWSASYHVVDAVGFDIVNKKIIVLDPDNNTYGGFGFPGDATPNNQVDYVSSEPLPVANGFGDVGGNVNVVTNSYLQSYSVDANGVITDGPYAGTKIDKIFVFGAIVPEPSTAALGMASLAAWAAYRRRSRRASANRPPL